ncbi:hypothetical protein [Desertivirga brevis]|uniref:hypothetical protein n=1 Tax=Desertivirga brevis TaxID=2810310 RepID=UPI001F613167|nr:hypothetical protein [Pedobacter sp. SYSU D00873]
MKNKTLSFTSLMAVILYCSLVLSACSKKVTFNPSSIVPAAQGYAKIKKDENKNYSISISIENLASPDKLQPPRNVYVAWIDTENNGTKNIGQLKSSSGFFTSALSGELTTVTPYKPTRVFITAEERATIDRPNMGAVLVTREF